MSNDILGSAPSLFTKLELTYKLANYPSSAELDKARIDSVIAAAFDKWRVASPFTFKPITSGTPDVALSFGSVSNNTAYGQTNWREHTIVFDNSRTWIDTEVIWFTSRPDLLSVAVHEIGHVLGLPDNDIKESVMDRTLDAFEGAKYRKPIPQVDIDTLHSVNVSLFSEHYAKKGQVNWYKRRKSFSISYVPEHLIPRPPPAATELMFYQVSAGHDGTVWAVDGYSFAYDYGANDEGKDWIFRGGWLSRVAVLDSRLVLGIFTDQQWGSPYGDLRRYNYATREWISVDNGSLGSSAKFKNIAIGGAKDKEEVWAVVTPRTNWGRRGTLPSVNFRGDLPLPPRQFYVWGQDRPEWRELYQGIIPLAVGKLMPSWK
jgi:hypothetical protein